MFSVFTEFRFRHENGAKIGQERRADHFWSEKLTVEFFATDTPEPRLLGQKSCLACLLSFGSGTKTVRKSARRAVLTTFGAKNLQLNFSQRTHPNHAFWAKSHV